jgi:RNA polymerase sigma factor (sigma-70 family)
MESTAATAFRRHYQQVYRYVRRRNRSHVQAEDIAQEVFAEAAARLGPEVPGAPPALAWLYTVAKRRLADEARRATAAPALVVIEPDDEPQEYGPAVARALRAAIAELPELQRQVVLMKLVQGRTFADIADRVDSTEAACKMRFARGLERLRDHLEQEGITP